MLVLGGASFGVHAQDASQAAPEAAPTEEQPPANDDAAATDEEAPATVEEEAPAVVEGALSDEELQALVAPIALYPDLVLVLTLQASLEPLDIVQADRFLAAYAEDASLEPDPGWDESVVGLLNYPTVVKTMSADLTWTQNLSDALISQLEGVQDAIQDFRAFMRAIGALESNEQVTVIAEGDFIRIEPTDEDAVFIPQYDPEALLAALYSTGAAPAEAGAEAVAEPEGEVVEEATEQVVTESEAVEEGAPVEYAAPAAVAVPAAAPAYYPAVAPPPVTYSDPSPSWLGTAATFAGGAVVGGLVGWAIADDDDDNHNDGDSYNRGNIDIEDSNVVINRGGGNEDLDDLRRDLEDEREDQQERRQDQAEETREDAEDRREESRERQEDQRADSKAKLEDERLKRDAREKAQREQAKGALEQRSAGRQPSATQAGGERKVAGLSTSGPREAAAPTRSASGDKQLAAPVDQAKTKAAPSREATRVAPARSSSKTARPGDSQRPQAASAFGGTSKSASEARRDADRGVQSRSHARTEVKPSRSPASGGAFAQRGGGSKAVSKSWGQKSRRGR